MNRTDRLLAIVLELQRKGRQRAEDLAATFETSKRTIYRDLEALGEAGVPLLAIPGQGYSLMEGYFLPPLSFSTVEATMLLMGADFIAQHFDAQYRQAAITASAKIDGVLPERLRAEVHTLQERIHLIAVDSSSNPAQSGLLQQVRRALMEHVTVRFRYTARHRSTSASSEPEETTIREVDPYALVHLSNAWYMSGYCHMRQGIRNFRLDRIDDLELLAHSFQPPENVSKMLPEHQRTRSTNMKVRVLFDAEIARWVRENRSFYMVSEEETAEGLLVTLQIRQESEILNWLLSWGSHVRVLEPEALRQRLFEEASAMLRNHAHTAPSISSH
jgi:predicted DNA-binding transcriptional regulator YafY